MNRIPKQPSFSRRRGYHAPTAEITVREDAPEELRTAFLAIASEDMSLSPSTLRSIFCGALRKRPDPNNWSEWPNIWSEVESLAYRCEWFRVYDLIEAVYQHLTQSDPARAPQFQELMNECFCEMGIGWQLVEGFIETRGPEAFESAVRGAVHTVEAAALPTAASELHEALGDLSRRPHPDLTGAVQHSMAALECVARDVTGDHKATLGQILQRHPGLLPPPLDSAVEKTWGYASESARHVREGRTVDRAEAELVVGMAAVAATYLVTKTRPG